MCFGRKLNSLEWQDGLNSRDREGLGRTAEPGRKECCWHLQEQNRAPCGGGSEKGTIVLPGFISDPYFAVSKQICHWNLSKREDETNNDSRALSLYCGRTRVATMLAEMEPDLWTVPRASLRSSQTCSLLWQHWEVANGSSLERASWSIAMTQVKQDAQKCWKNRFLETRIPSQTVDRTQIWGSIYDCAWAIHEKENSMICIDWQN